MSLINQMLQDLEHRSVGNLAAEGMSQQVRAVPERGGVHIAWWLVLVLALLLAGTCGWFWTRPAPPVVMAPPLVLKLAPDLQTLPSPAAQAPLPPDQAMPAPAPPVPAAVAQDTRRDDHLRDNKPSPAVPAANRLPQAAPKAPVIAANAGINTAMIAEMPAKPIGDAGTATELTKQIKELTPQQQAENDYRLAAAALQLGRQADAIGDLERALQRDGQHVAAREMLVGLLLQAKRMDDAMRRAQEGLAIDPTQVGLTMILARVQVEMGDLHAALNTLEHGLSFARESADYQAFLAALLQRDKRNKDAVEHYLVALGKEQQNAVWWMGLGISLQAENRLPEAKEAFVRAKTLNTLTPDLLAFVDQKLAQMNAVKK